MRARLCIALLATVLVSACASTDTRLPAVDLPASTATHVAGIERWWAQFSDPQLTTLIEEALAANLDLRLAVARIDEARASLRLARSSLYPSLDADFGASRSRRSQSTDFAFPGPQISTTFSGGLQAAYEVDLWGRLGAGRNAAQAQLLATRYSAETVRTALAAQVASTYFALRALDAELEIARNTLGTRTENIKLLKQRFDAGLIGEYELRLSGAERSSVAASIPALERAIAQSEAALAVLAGRSAREVYTPMVARGNELAAIAATSATGPEVPAGLPADLLARRPDIRQAEANLVAASARIDEARAQYFPTLILTGRFGGESSDLADLFSAPARIWSIAGSLLQPIIGAARIGAQVDAATARRIQAEIGYLQSVQAAFRDAHDALVAHRSARDVFVAQDERRTQLIDALRLSDLRYRGGYSSFIDVLDNQRNLLDAERARVNALRDRQTALVDLYKALGGGWSPEVFAQTQAPPR